MATAAIRGADTEDDSEAEREEVWQSLLSPVIPSSAAQCHQQHATQISMPGISSAFHQSLTPAVQSFHSSTPASPSPVHNSLSMLMSQQQPLPLPSNNQLAPLALPKGPETF
jgi:hypothetical protein